MPEGKILIVDDEPDVTAYLTAVLANAGYTAYRAATADEGFELLEVIQPDAVCLDIMMPGKLGLTLYAKLRKDERFKDIPVILISGVASEEEFEFKKLLPDESLPPPQEYLEKPINRAQFLTIIGQLLKQNKKADC